MRPLLVLASLSLLALALPAPAEAHVVTCGGGDLSCYLQCELSHRHSPDPHDCAFAYPDVVGDPVPTPLLLLA